MKRTEEEILMFSFFPALMFLHLHSSGVSQFGQKSVAQIMTCWPRQSAHLLVFHLLVDEELTLQAEGC